LNITIKIVQRITNCAQIWDGFLPEKHHLFSSHLLAFEHANIDDIENFYVQVYLKNKLIGLVYLQQFQFKHKHLNFNKGQVLLSKLIKLVFPNQLPILVCGHLFRINFQGFYFKNPLHKIHVFDTIKLFTHQQKDCKTRGVIIKDCDEVFIEQNCKPFQYQFFNGDVTMEIHRRITWHNFEDYLNDLHKKYLQRAKKIIKSFEAIVVKELGADEILSNNIQINTLYRNVVDKQAVKLGIVNAHYFYEMKKDLQHNFQFNGIYKNEILVGFYTFIKYDNNMETHFIGLDYEANKQHQIYFNILFLGIAKMIDLKLNSLELGRTARDAKANVGALPKQIFNYIYVNNILIKFVLNHFLKSFNKAENFNLVQRTPLK